MSSTLRVDIERDVEVIDQGIGFVPVARGKPKTDVGG
jgi:hypothetical protein